MTSCNAPISSIVIINSMEFMWVYSYCINSSKSIDWRHTHTQKETSLFVQSNVWRCIWPATVFAYKLKLKRNYLQKFNWSKRHFQLSICWLQCRLESLEYICCAVHNYELAFFSHTNSSNWMNSLKSIENKPKLEIIYGNE